MTAQEIVDNVARQLTGLKISDTSVASNEATLLRFLNLAKNKIAIDTRIWLGGETVAMTTANEYTLTETPIQIIDVYKDNLDIIERNKSGDNGYFQTSPKVLYINKPEDGVNFNVNYYYTPTDYSLGDVVDFPPSLELAVEHFMKSMAYDIYKSEKEQQLAVSNMDKYRAEKDVFISYTDTGNTDTLLDIDPIAQRGLV